MSYTRAVSVLRLHLAGRGRPPTRSAWNWANEDSSRSRARATPDRADQVDGHVVGRPERRPQRVRTGGGEAGDVARVDLGRPHHDGVALDVDAAAAGPAGELRVLPRRQVDVGLAVELHQPFEHDAAGRHVDAERQRLGGEDGLDQAPHEQLLDDLLEDRQHAGVMGGEPALEPVEPLPVAEHLQVVGRDRGGAGLRDLADLGALVRRRSAAGRPGGTAARRRRTPARLKMNRIAGSSPSRSRRSTTSARSGGG